MGGFGLGVKRARSQSSLLLSIAVVVALICGFLLGGAGYLSFASTALARTALSTAPPRDAAVRFETPLGTDAAAQSAGIDADLARTIAPIRHEVTRTVRAAPVAATVDGAALVTTAGAPAELALGVDGRLRDSAVLVDGAWPATSGSEDASVLDGALQSSAARSLGLTVGDTVVTESGLSVRIAALWKPRDSADPRWFADLATTGSERDEVTELRAYGPLIVPESALPIENSTAQWTVTVRAADLTAGGLPTVATFAGSATRALEADQEATDGSIDTSGGLSRTAGRIAADLRTIVGITPIGTILLGIIGLAALLQLSTLLVATRRQESVLLRSRGASVARIVGGTAVDAALAGVVGAAAGTGAATAVLAATVGPVAPNWLLAAAVAAAVTVIFTVVALADARKLTRRDSIDDSGRGRGTATLTAAVLVVAAAGFAVFQLRLYGSPLIASGGARARVDPVAVSAPAIAILAVALFAVVAFRPAASGALRLAASRRGLSPFLPLAQVVRRSGAFAVIVLLLAATVGSTVFVGSLQSTATALGDRTGALRLGAPVRVTPKTVNALRPLDFAATPGVTAAAVSSERIEIDDFLGRLVAVTDGAMRTVMSDVGGSVDPDRLARALHDPAPIGVALPKSATALRLRLSSSSAVVRESDPSRIPNGEVRGALWLADDEGIVIRRKLTPLGLSVAPATSTSSLALPRASGRWRIVAVDLNSDSPLSYAIDLSLGDIVAQVGETPVSVPAPTSSWTLQGARPSGADIAASTTGAIGIKFASGGSVDLRLMPPSSPGAGPIDDAPPPLPIAVTSALARAFDLSAGTRIDLVLSQTGQPQAAIVRAITPVVPGSTAGYSVLADLNAYVEGVLRSGADPTGVTQLWLRADADRLPAIRRIAGSATVETAQAGSTAAAGVAITTLWIAGIGAALLALGAVVAAAVSLSRLRLPDVRALSSTGLSLRAQRRGRRVELVTVSLFGALFGAAGGLAVSALTAAPIARSVVPDSAALPAQLGIAVLPTLPVIAAVLLGVAAIAVLSTGRQRPRDGRW